jgi:hypothetical protein
MTTSEPSQRPLDRYIKYILILLGIVLVVLVFFLVREYVLLRRADLANKREASLSAFEQQHGPLNGNEVGVIRSWMTFAYINGLFGLPKDYLKEQLQITNPSYPTETVYDYSNDASFSTTAATMSVQKAVEAYFKTNSITSASATSTASSTF